MICYSSASRSESNLTSAVYRARQNIKTAGGKGTDEAIKWSRVLAQVADSKQTVDRRRSWATRRRGWSSIITHMRSDNAVSSHAPWQTILTPTINQNSIKTRRALQAEVRAARRRGQPSFVLRRTAHFRHTTLGSKKTAEYDVDLADLDDILRVSTSSAL